MSLATQIAYRAFDEDFFRLSVPLRGRIQAKIDDMGERLDSYSHQRLKGGERFKLRVGDYRIIYHFSIEPPEIHLLAIGHRREIYRWP